MEGAINKVMDRLGPGTKEGNTDGLKDGVHKRTKEGWFNVTRHRGCYSNKPLSAILSIF